MEYRKFGQSDLTVSVIGFGSGFRSGITDYSIKIIQKSLDLGINFIDTAETYQRNGRYSEEVLGKAINGRRGDVIIATKVAREHLRYDDVLKAAEGSLRRLNIKTIDLHQIHGPNPSIPIEETIKAMEKLVSEGKIRYIGVSNFSVSQMIEAQEALHKSEIISNQVYYNMLKRDIENKLIPYCRREHIAIIAHSPLAMGLLTGKYTEKNITSGNWRSRNPPFKGENLKKGLEVVKVLREIAKIHGKTPAQVALNWIISKPQTFAIPGASKLSQVEENVGATNWRLTKKDLEQIERVIKVLNRC
ncbi:MAG: aldo/keto reductase [Desulfobacterales bacterium]|nr:aldo/keto reductase [Desulfobacterales bacterium]